MRLRTFSLIGEFCNQDECTCVLHRWTFFLVLVLTITCLKKQDSFMICGGWLLAVLGFKQTSKI
jgi:hypothetical protein